jgi:hypothetical protein
MDMIDSILLDMRRAPAGSLVAAPSPNDEFADDAELRAGFDDHGLGARIVCTTASPGAPFGDSRSSAATGRS